MLYFALVLVSQNLVLSFFRLVFLTPASHYIVLFHPFYFFIFASCILFCLFLKEEILFSLPIIVLFEESFVSLIFLFSFLDPEIACVLLFSLLFCFGIQNMSGYVFCRYACK